MHEPPSVQETPPAQPVSDMPRTSSPEKAADVEEAGAAATDGAAAAVIHTKTPSETVALEEAAT